MNWNMAATCKLNARLLTWELIRPWKMLPIIIVIKLDCQSAGTRHIFCAQILPWIFCFVGNLANILWKLRKNGEIKIENGIKFLFESQWGPALENEKRNETAGLISGHKVKPLYFFVSVNIIIIIFFILLVFNAIKVYLSTKGQDFQ